MMAKLKAITGFSGGGGVECGLIAAGIEPVLSVERDPSNTWLSSRIANIHELNFWQHSEVLRKTVEEWEEDNYQPCPEKIDAAHFSPVCANFSRKSTGGETNKDIRSAYAIANFIGAKQPDYFTLENVKGYENSISDCVITGTLLEKGYKVSSEVLDLSEYGIPQSRKRYFIVAHKSDLTFDFHKLKEPKIANWHDEIADLIPELPEIKMTPNQEKAIAKYGGDLPCLLPRVGYSKLPPIRDPQSPAFTITKSLFIGNKNDGRSRVWDIWDGKVLRSASLECFRRWACFPDWYQFHEKMSVSGSILGYAVPPIIITKIYRQLLGG